MTVQTDPYLKGTEFTLTGAAGRITAAYAQDLIDSKVNVRQPRSAAKTTAYTLASSDIGSCIDVNGTYAITVPAAAFLSIGDYIDVYAVSGSPTLSPSSLTPASLPTLTAGTMVRLTLRAAGALAVETRKPSIATTDLTDWASATASFGSNEAALTYASTTTWNMTTSPAATLTLTGSPTIALSGGAAGRTYRLAVIQGGSGNYTATFSGATVLGALAFSGAVGAVTLFSADVVGSTIYISQIAASSAGGGTGATSTRYLADASPWNTPIPSTGVTRTTVSGMSALGAGPTSWDGGVINMYTATASDPLVQVLWADTWANIDSGTWLRTGNTTAKETAILAASTVINTIPVNPYSTQNAALAWNDGGAAANGTYTAWSQTAALYINCPAGAAPADTSDGHVTIIQPDGRALEMYSAIRMSTGKWVAEMYSYTQPETELGIGAENGRCASMISNYAGIIRDAEINEGIINHAIAVVISPTMLTTSYVYPALAFDSNPGYSGTLPMGTRLGLPAAFNVAGLSTTVGKIIAQALVTYGAFIVDRGGTGGISVVTQGNTTVPLLQSSTTNMQNDFNTMLHALQKIT